MPPVLPSMQGGGASRPASASKGTAPTHTCGSLLFASGKNAKQVAGWLGHADPAFTLRTYIHLLDGGLGDADALDGLVSPAFRALGGDDRDAQRLGETIGELTSAGLSSADWRSLVEQASHPGRLPVPERSQERRSGSRGTIEHTTLPGQQLGFVRGHDQDATRADSQSCGVRYGSAFGSLRPECRGDEVSWPYGGGP